MFRVQSGIIIKSRGENVVLSSSYHSCTLGGSKVVQMRDFRGARRKSSSLPQSSSSSSSSSSSFLLMPNRKVADSAESALQFVFSHSSSSSSFNGQVWVIQINPPHLKTPIQQHFGDLAYAPLHGTLPRE